MKMSASSSRMRDGYGTPGSVFSPVFRAKTDAKIGLFGFLEEYPQAESTGSKPGLGFYILNFSAYSRALTK